MLHDLFNQHATIANLCPRCRSIKWIYISNSSTWNCGWSKSYFFNKIKNRTVRRGMYEPHGILRSSQWSKARTGAPYVEVSRIRWIEAICRRSMTQGPEHNILSLCMYLQHFGTFFKVMIYFNLLNKNFTLFLVLLHQQKNVALLKIK